MGSCTQPLALLPFTPALAYFSREINLFPPFDLTPVLPSSPFKLFMVGLDDLKGLFQPK